MPLTDALLHPWLGHKPSNAAPAARAPPTTSQPQPSPPVPTPNPAAAHALDRNLSDLSELSSLPDDAEVDVANEEVQRDVSMLSAAPSADDMPRVHALNITSPAQARVRAPLVRRSQVLAQELADEADEGVSPTAAAANANANGSGKRTRDAAGSLDGDVAMGEGGPASGPDSDGAGAAQVPRAAKRGRRDADGQELPPPQGNATGRALRSRNAGGAAAPGAAPR
jgi:hypothetical protein